MAWRDSEQTGNVASDLEELLLECGRACDSGLIFQHRQVDYVWDGIYQATLELSYLYEVTLCAAKNGSEMHVPTFVDWLE